MSIATRKGDQGTTALMYNRTVPKNHPRVEACGAVDELNAALGMVRASGDDARVREWVSSVQSNLFTLMGEIATLPEDAPRYLRDGYPAITPAQTARLDAQVKELESEMAGFSGWAKPGANLQAASLDVARTVCRRAERRLSDLHQAGELANQEILVFMNRLSDLLWLLARSVEAPGKGG